MDHWHDTVDAQAPPVERTPEAPPRLVSLLHLCALSLNPSYVCPDVMDLMHGPAKDDMAERIPPRVSPSR